MFSDRNGQVRISSTVGYSLQVIITSCLSELTTAYKYLIAYRIDMIFAVATLCILINAVFFF